MLLGAPGLTTSSKKLKNVRFTMAQQGPTERCSSSLEGCSSVGAAGKALSC